MANPSIDGERVWSVETTPVAMTATSILPPVVLLVVVIVSFILIIPGISIIVDIVTSSP
jgi:hypothetical protein